MRLRQFFLTLFCSVPILANGDTLIELDAKQTAAIHALQTRSAAVSDSIANSVAVEQEKNYKRIKIQLKIDKLHNETWKPNITKEERISIQQELVRLQVQLNKL
ncbi:MULTISPECIES: hypothetical protein [Serratia]|uniref:hypothetical protein n=1 Tax=Serratia TaxID=613 RepID=UPI001BD24444|nr:hypothetical protein [Serratia marcescens]